MDKRTSKVIRRGKNSSHRTIIKHYSKSRSAILCYVRRLHVWHRRSIINGTNKMNLISANSRLLPQAELRLSSLMRKCTAIIYTLTEHEILILGFKHPIVLFTDHKPIIILFTQKSSSNHRVYRFQLILMKIQTYI